jgi:hypothetical protein
MESTRRKVGVVVVGDGGEPVGPGAKALVLVAMSFQAAAASVGIEKRMKRGVRRY